ncbi:MAG: class II fructose-bisphosphate aldolase [Candidatus Aenigmarchaeota archaeon]|nr:class II fructose-bisphosphate aldolase [Candidatus Aenigmarchaeota archaeon]
MAKHPPISGASIFDAMIKDNTAITMAANIRYIPGVAKGVFRAAKDTNSPLIIEIARSECNLDGGYTGYTPKTFAEQIQNVADEVEYPYWSLHADHIGIKKDDAESMKATINLVKAQIDADFTSFGIDASHLFDFDGNTTKEQLQPNLNATMVVAKYIEDEMSKNSYGLEVEVGEIGRTDESGFVITTQDEAVTFIKELNDESIYPQVLAISNGSAHGNIYDGEGRPIEQSSIDVEQTTEIVKALNEAYASGIIKRPIRIAQHGITGTPLRIIAEDFPKGDIIKGNVATHFQNIVFDTIKNEVPDLYNEIYGWVIENYSSPGKTEEEVFGKNAKFALKQYFTDLNNLDQRIVDNIEAKTYTDCLEFFKPFNSIGKAKLIKI